MRNDTCLNLFSVCVQVGRDVIIFNTDMMAEIQFLAIASQVNEE